LHQDRNNLTVCQSILEPVPDDKDEGKALPGLVRTRRWFGGKSSPKFVQHPMLRRIEPLEMLLQSPSLYNRENKKQ